MKAFKFLTLFFTILVATNSHANSCTLSKVSKTCLSKGQCSDLKTFKLKSIKFQAYHIKDKNYSKKATSYEFLPDALGKSSDHQKYAEIALSQGEGVCLVHLLNEEDFSNQ